MPGHKAKRWIIDPDESAEKRPPGRPPKLTPELTEQIAARLKAGNFRETACASVGIASRTLRIWLRQAAKDNEAGLETRFTKLSEALDVAEGDAEHIALQMARKSGAKDWRFWTWWLEHKCNRRWGYKATVEHTGADGGPMRHELSPAEIQAAVASRFGGSTTKHQDDDSSGEG